MRNIKILMVFAVITSICLVSLSAQCGIKREAPTIELQIYDGPDYSESDDMCYYRVEAVVEGTPDPDVEFSEDDNVEVIGSGRAEVSVENGGSYNLIATATNTAGTATASIILSGECAERVTEAGEEEEGEEAEDEDGQEPEEEEEEEEEAEGEAPTIAVEIYEGPTPADGLCYYRVQANVTGTPKPEIEWSKDDSNGAWGSKKAQVNLSNPSETYTLTATATNSEGTASASIELDWGCEIPEPEPEIAEDSSDIGANTGLSGWIWVGSLAHPGATLAYVGDNSGDTELKTYLSFDIDAIGDLDNVTINSVSVIIPLDTVEPVHNHPELAASLVVIKVYDYGNSLDLSDQAAGGTEVKTIGTTDSLTNFNFSSAKLKEELQDAVDIDKDWFQLKLGLNNKTNDGIADYYRLYTDHAVLHVEYEYEESP